MQARFPFFRQKTALAAREGILGQILGEERGRAARSRRRALAPIPTAMRRVAGGLRRDLRDGTGQRTDRSVSHVRGRFPANPRARPGARTKRMRPPEVFRRTQVVRPIRTDWRIRRSRSSWCRRHGRVQPTCSGRRWSSSRACRWRTDGRGGRPSGRCCNRRRPR